MHCCWQIRSDVKLPSVSPSAMRTSLQVRTLLFSVCGFTLWRLMSNFHKISLSFHKQMLHMRTEFVKWSKMSFALVSVFFPQLPSAQITRNLTWNVCFDFLNNLCLKKFSFYKELIEILSWRCIGLHVKYPLWLTGFNETWIFSKDFLKILKYKISQKSVQWEPSCSVWTDGHTNSRFSQLCKCV